MFEVLVILQASKGHKTSLGAVATIFGRGGHRGRGEHKQQASIPLPEQSLGLKRSQGETSRRRSQEAQGTPPEREESQDAGQSTPNVPQEKAASSSHPPAQHTEMAQELLESPSRSQSHLLLSSPEMPASQHDVIPPSQPGRRHVVAPLPDFESIAADMEGDGQQNLPVAVSPGTTHSSAGMAIVLQDAAECKKGQQMHQLRVEVCSLVWRGAWCGYKGCREEPSRHANDS
ncbi:uncharacterized protein LOC144824278 [Lissotriton helveticus]